MKNFFNKLIFLILFTSSFSIFSQNNLDSCLFIKQNLQPEQTESIFLDFYSNASFFETEIERIYNKKINIDAKSFIFYHLYENLKLVNKNKNINLLNQNIDTKHLINQLSNYLITDNTKKKCNKNYLKKTKYIKLISNIKRDYKKCSKNSILDTIKFAKTTNKLLIKTFGIKPRINIESNKLFFLKTIEEPQIFELIPTDYYSFISDISQNTNQLAYFNYFDSTSQQYYNLSLNNFILSIIYALDSGFTSIICLNNKELSNTFISDSLRMQNDIYSKIDDVSFYHIVGYLKENDKYTFCSKNFYGINYCFSEEYLKNHCLSICMHKYAAKEIMNKIIK